MSQASERKQTNVWEIFIVDSRRRKMGYKICWKEYVSICDQGTSTQKSHFKEEKNLDNKQTQITSFKYPHESVTFSNFIY